MKEKPSHATVPLKAARGKKVTESFKKAAF
jgi:hypothetical protein